MDGFLVQFVSFELCAVISYIMVIVHLLGLHRVE